MIIEQKYINYCSQGIEHSMQNNLNSSVQCRPVANSKLLELKDLVTLSRSQQLCDQVLKTEFLFQYILTLMICKTSGTDNKKTAKLKLSPTWPAITPGNRTVCTNLDTCNLNHEHSGAEHMSSIVAPELDTADIHLLMEINRFNAVHAGFNIFFCVQHLICCYITNFNIVRQQPSAKSSRACYGAHTTS